MLEHGIAKDSAVGVKNRVITGLYGVAETPLAKETINARELPMFPGVADSHVHSYGMTGVEDFERLNSAAAGGLTTFIELPYDTGTPQLRSIPGKV